MKRTITAKSVFMDDFENSLSIDREKASMENAKENGKKADYEHHKRCVAALQERGNQLKDLGLRIQYIELPYQVKVNRWKRVATLSIGLAVSVVLSWLIALFR